MASIQKKGSTFGDMDFNVAYLGLAKQYKYSICIINVDYSALSFMYLEHGTFYE